ncbi:hypothetical protein KBI51_02555 [Aerococcaceae bacterium zg-ZUI334]|uniref:DUF6900 domain-containing protein n=1 Tax=Aerococcaceae bacterium zg-252 TaxID=2796928 RepID=UPI001B97D17B|nr:hypothetical protein [Aerococcaceae bacterium zg-ZUI334]MBS4761171.1 hypothetical protein [Carnobacteriaceae bacterium zg-ZUI252]
MTQALNEKLYEVAEKHIFSLEGRGDLVPRMRDNDDFLDVYVMSLEKLLKEVYELGKADGKNEQ